MGPKSLNKNREFEYFSETHFSSIYKDKELVEARRKALDDRKPKPPPKEQEPPIPVVSGETFQDRTKRVTKNILARNRQRVSKTFRLTQGENHSLEFMSVEEAFELLDKSLSDFLDKLDLFLTAPDDNEAPILSLKARAGLGKSSTFIRKSADLATRARILYVVPTLKLASELHAKFTRQGTACMVLRGRDQKTYDGERMCERSFLANRLASLGTHSVKSSLCLRTCKDEDGTDREIRCDHYEGCPYIRQMADLQAMEHGVVITANQFLTTALEAVSEKNVDLLVIDEGFHQAFYRDKLTVNLDTLCTPRACGRFEANEDGILPRFYDGYNPNWSKTEKRRFFESKKDEEQDRHVWWQWFLSKASELFRETRTDGSDLTIQDVFNVFDYGCAETFEQATRIEYGLLHKDTFSPEMADDEISELLTQAHQKSENLRYARVWKALANDVRVYGQMVLAGGVGNDELTSLKRLWLTTDPKTGETTNRLQVFYSRESRFGPDVPKLIMDASLDIGLVERYFGQQAGENNVEIMPALNAYVTQVWDKSFSKSYLGNDRNKLDLWFFALRIALDSGLPKKVDTFNRPMMAQKVLLIVDKQTEDFWIQRNLIESKDAIETPKRDVLPFWVEHQNNVRGLDSYKDCRAVIVASRMLPTVEAVEGQARATYAGSLEELILIDPEYKAWPKRPHFFHMWDGQTYSVDIEFHPDERINALLRGIREEELQQCVSRARLLHREEPCDVFVLTNVPLDGVLVDALVSWENICPSKHEIALLQGFFPLNSRHCAMVYPDLWPSHEACRKDRLRWTKLIESDHGLDFSQIVIQRMAGKRHYKLINYTVKTDKREIEHLAFVYTDGFEDDDDIIWRLHEQFDFLKNVMMFGIVPFEEDAEDFERMAEVCGEIQQTADNQHKTDEGAQQEDEIKSFMTQNMKENPPPKLCA